MRNILSSWMTLGNKRSYRVRRRQNKLEWLQLCRQSAVAEKGVCYLQCIFIVIKVMMLRMRRY